MANVETKARRGEATADFFPLLGVDHIEFYVGNAKQAALFYERGFGFLNVAHSGLETGARQVASYVMEQGNIRLVFSSAYAPDHAIARLAHVHGDGVGVIALAVPDAERAYREATRRGAEAAIEPVVEEDEHGVLRHSAVHGYGDTL
ncbi:MAG: VOC family protein, partial [Gemmatimonadetes bacterium]|nr:VOC family protein [Gemmatimonadota bacterium]